MNTMRFLTAGIIVGLLSISAHAADKADKAKLLIGKWEVTKADDGTLPNGTIVEFSKDGKLTITVKVEGNEMKVDGTYKVDGDKFDIVMKMGDQEHKQTITIKKISKTELSTTDKDGKSVELVRKK